MAYCSVDVGKAIPAVGRATTVGQTENRRLRAACDDGWGVRRTNREAVVARVCRKAVVVVGILATAIRGGFIPRPCPSILPLAYCEAALRPCRRLVLACVCIALGRACWIDSITQSLLVVVLSRVVDVSRWAQTARSIRRRRPFAEVIPPGATFPGLAPCTGCFYGLVGSRGASSAYSIAGLAVPRKAANTALSKCPLSIMVTGVMITHDFSDDAGDGVILTRIPLVKRTSRCATWRHAGDELRTANN